MNDDSFEDLSLIGKRIRMVRQRRGKSLEVVAGLSGISMGHLSEIERGFYTPRIEHLLTIANVLEVSPSDLMQLPFPAPGNGHIDAGVQAVRLAVLGANHGQPGGRIAPLKELRYRVGYVLDLSWRCDQPKTVGSLLPDIIKDLHTSILAGRDVPELLDLAGMLHYHATLWWLRVAGASLDLRGQVTALMMQVARERDTPEAFGLAVGGGIHVSVLSGAMDLAREELGLVPTISGDSESLQVAGALMLSKSWVASVAGERGNAEDALMEANELARQTGQGNMYGLAFGPIEVGMWRILALVEIGDYEQAAHVGREVNLDAHPHRSRQANGWGTYARALAGVHGRQEDAVLALKRAEAILPLEVQRNQRVRDLLAQMITKARHDAIGTELRGMAYRAGVL